MATVDDDDNATTVWSKHVTPAGKTYYYNKATKKSQWDCPTELLNASEEEVWEEKFDAGSNRSYYFQRNKKTTQWKKPTGPNVVIKPYKTKRKTATMTATSSSSSPKKAKLEDSSNMFEEMLQEQEEKQKLEETSYEETAVFISDIVENDREDSKITTTGTTAGTTTTTADGDLSTLVSNVVNKNNSTNTTLSESTTTETSTIESLLSGFKSKDAVMDTNILDRISTFFNTADNPYGPEVVIQTLSSSYRGYAQMTLLMSKWIDSLSNTNSSQSLLYDFITNVISNRYVPPESNDGPPDWLEEMLLTKEWRKVLIQLAESHKGCSLLSYAVQSISSAGHHLEIASTTTASTYFSVFSGVLVESLLRVVGQTSLECEEEQQYSEMLITLASHDEFTFMYTIHILSLLEERVNNATSSVRRMAQLLSSRVARNVGFLGSPYVRPFTLISQQRFKESELVSCIHTLRSNEGQRDPKTLETLVTLYQIREQQQRGDISSSDTPPHIPPVAHLRDPIVLKVLLNAAYSSSSSSKKSASDDRSTSTLNNIRLLLSYASVVSDDRLITTNNDDEKNAVVLNIKDFNETLDAITLSSDICRSDATLGYNIRSGGKIQELVGLIPTNAVVSMGICHWIRTSGYVGRTTTTDGKRKKISPSLRYIIYPCFCIILKTVIKTQYRQWDVVFDILKESLEFNSNTDDDDGDYNPIKTLELRKKVLSLMVTLMCSGYVTPVLKYVHHTIEDLDQALCRNFVSSLVKKIRPPYSVEFVTAFSAFLTTPCVSASVVSSSNSSDKTLVLAFLKQCKSSGVLSKAQLSAIKGLKTQLTSSS